MGSIRSQQGKRPHDERVFPLFCNEIREPLVVTDNPIEQLALDKYPVPLWCDKKCAARTQKKTRSSSGCFFFSFFFFCYPSLFILLFFANLVSNIVPKYLCCRGSYCINTQAINRARKEMLTITHFCSYSDSKTFIGANDESPKCLLTEWLQLKFLM